MTWAKTGSEFPDECANVGLSDAAYRTHHEAITWLYTVERLDMLVPKRLAGRVMFSSNASAAVAELVAHGWWEDVGDAWRIRHHADVVRSSIATQQKKRAASKRTSQRHRAKKAAESSHQDSDVTPDVTRHPASQSDRQEAPRDAWSDVSVRGVPT
jgi:hypothetical protein